MMSASATLAIWDVRSASVRATWVALRSTAIADANSTTPKYITTMIGKTKANSIAASPLRSFNRSRTRSDIFCIRDTIIASRLYMKGGGRRKQPLAAVEISNVVAELGHEKRPCIEGANHDGIGRAGWRQRICERPGQVSTDDRIGNVNRGAWGKDLHIHRNVPQIAVAIEHHLDAIAEVGFERSFGHAGVLRFVREHLPRGVLRPLLQKRAREKHNRRLENRKQHAEEQRRNQCELDGSRTPAVAAKSVQCIS